MLKQQAKPLLLYAVLTDIAALFLGFCLAYGLRSMVLPLQFPNWFTGPLFGFESYIWMWPIILPLWAGLCAVYGLYDPSRLVTFKHVLVDLSKVAAINLTVLMGSTYALKMPDISRSFVLTFGVTSLVLVSLGRLFIRYRLRLNGRATLSNVVIVGTGEKAQDFARLVALNRKWGLNLLGLVSESKYGPCPERVGSYAVLGALDDLERICKTSLVDEVIFVIPGKLLSEMEEFFLICEELGVNARIAVGLFPHLIARATLEEFVHIPLLTFTTRPTNWVGLSVKRGIDLLIAWLAVVLGLPAWAFIAAVIRLDSKGSILFCQERCGLNGRRFTMYKFRSMVSDAECRIHEVVGLNELQGPVFKMRNDPRMTRVGRFLRRTSLDEVPQLLNVIKGDMSIVGPRPALPSEVDKYERWQRRRLSMKPGLTCIWAIRGRNEIPFEKWMQLDLEYIDNWSLWLDCRILARTIPIILSRRGAS